MNNDSKDMAEPGSTAIGRRDLLKKGAVAGAVVWTTPLVLSTAASAAEGGGGTAKCRPSITINCARMYCEQGGKWFPAIDILTSPCGCSENDQEPIVCVRFTNITSNLPGGGAVVAYGPETICGPKQSQDGNDQILSTGNWECINPDELVYFGKPRSGNGAISDMGTGTIFNFRLGVWAGGCPDQDSTDDAYNCQTWNAQILWNNGTNTATCTLTAAPPAQSLCSDQTELSPCGTCA